MLHAEQVKIISNNGEQGMFPDQNGHICLNKQSSLTHFHLPSAEIERTRVPTFHRFWAEQNKKQFRSDIHHRDPSMIDLQDASASTDHRHPNLVMPQFNRNTPPPPVVRKTVITDVPHLPWQPFPHLPDQGIHTSHYSQERILTLKEMHHRQHQTSKHLQL